MTHPKRPKTLLTLMVAFRGAVLAAGCSSSFGGGSPPSRTHVIVVPSGEGAVCSDGTAPPCR